MKKKPASKLPYPSAPANSRLSMPMTLKIAQADYLTAKQIALDHGVSISSVVRWAGALGLPKVRALFAKLDRRSA